MSTSRSSLSLPTRRPLLRRSRATARHRLEKTSRRAAAESLKIRLPAMVDSPRAIKSRASGMRSGPAVVSSADSSAAGSRSVAPGSNSVRNSVLDCPSITPLLITLVSPSRSRALGGESVSDGLATGTTSVIFSGFDMLVGPNHRGGSVGVVTFGSSAWASATVGWIAAAVRRGRGSGEEDGRGDPAWLTFWPSSPKNQHLR